MALKTRATGDTVRGLRNVENAAYQVVEAYRSRFETHGTRLFGPIDEQIEALEKALQRVP